MLFHRRNRQMLAGAATSQQSLPDANNQKPLCMASKEIEQFMKSPLSCSLFHQRAGSRLVPGRMSIVSPRRIAGAPSGIGQQLRH